jgi:glycerol-3-phosphate dehydrogenase
MNRSQLLAAARDSAGNFDIAIIGGGATGLGCAVEAAARGYRTVLVERADFAQGTSSRSTKLIHGGVRYLRQGNLHLVSESLRERARLLRNAPHLVHPLRFVLPTRDLAETAFYAAGLKLYDLLARGSGLESSRVLDARATRELAPTLDPAKFSGGISYLDAQFDDARLAITLARTAADLGAIPLNYFSAVQFLKRDECIRGLVARDAETGNEIEFRAKAFINAAGVFGDEVSRLDDPGAASHLAPSQGAHIVLSRKFLPSDAAIIIPRTADGRVLFAIPWENVVLIGTTHTPMNSTPAEPRPLREELEFLLEHARRYLAPKPVESDILCAFAGLRPLVKTSGPTSRMPRDHSITTSRSGLMTVAGGKWTTYRQMGEDTIDAAEKIAGFAPRISTTASLRLHGAGEATTGLTDFRPVDYGSDSAALEKLARENPGWLAPLHPRLAAREVEVVWAARHEMARRVEDVLSRRTRSLIHDARASAEAAPRVAALLAAELGRDAAWQRAEVEAYCQLARAHLPTAA